MQVLTLKKHDMESLRNIEVGTGPKVSPQEAHCMKQSEEPL